MKTKTGLIIILAAAPSKNFDSFLVRKVRIIEIFLTSLVLFKSYRQSTKELMSFLKSRSSFLITKYKVDSDCG